jgi:1-acyl-sn-glycerol-3-phosphate acyltransferase
VSIRTRFFRLIARPLTGATFVALRAWARWGLQLRVRGRENMPVRGPFIVAINENSLVCMFVEGVVMADTLAWARRERKLMSFAAEEFWAW